MDLTLLLHDAVEAVPAPPLDPVAAVRRRRARTRVRRRLQVTAGAVLGLVVVGQALLPPSAAGAVRPQVTAVAAP